MTDTELGETFIDTAYRLEAEGAELYLEVVGPPDAPPIFYLHGGPGYNSYSFRDLMGDELERYTLIYADQRGAGRSPTLNREDNALNLEQLTDDVVAILDGLELEQTTLLAHGFGAMVALGVAKQYPERVTRLILVNPWVDMSLLARAMQREAARLSDHEDELSQADEMTPAERALQATSWLGAKQLFDAMEFPKVGSRLRLEHADAESFAGLAESVPTDPTSADIWALNVDPTGVMHSTVILIGKDDKTCYLDQAERILSAMPHALTSLLDAGHYPWLDDPETFTSLLHEVMGLDEVTM